MPKKPFKNFSDLRFIQSVDTPRFLVPLLNPHRALFASKGIDLASLDNRDEHDRLLLEFFTTVDEIPFALLDALYLLDDLCDEPGHDRILSIAEEAGVSLDGIVGAELTPGEFAIAVYLANESIIRTAYDHTHYRKIKNYQEFQAIGNKPLTLRAVKAARNDLVGALGDWFESKNRSRACEIHAYEEDDEIKIQIMHGQTFRADGSIDRNLQRSRVGWRPQKHDAVIYDLRTRVLKVNGQTVAEKALYRRAIGKALFGDPEYFPSGDIYTLAPLGEGVPLLSLPAGIRSAQLVEVWIEVDADARFVQISKATNLSPMIHSYGFPNLATGTVVRAAFSIRYASGGRARRLEIRPPNVAIYDRARDADAAEAFIQANGFSKLDLQCAA